MGPVNRCHSRISRVVAGMAPVGMMLVGMMLVGMTAVGCGAPGPRGRERLSGPPHSSGGPTPRGPLCTFEGRWRGGPLRSPAGLAFAQVRGARSRLRLEEVDGELRVLADVSSEGLHLSGWLDPSHDTTVRVREAMWLGEGVAIAPNSPLRVLEARPSQLVVGLSNIADLVRDEVRPLREYRRSIPCDAVTLFDEDAEASEEAVMALLGLPSRGVRRQIAGSARVELLDRPGGSPIVQIGAPTLRSNGTLRGHHVVRVLESRGEWSRVSLRHFTRTVFVGWLRSEHLSADTSSSHGVGGLGMLGAAPFCQEGVRVTVYAGPRVDPSALRPGESGSGESGSGESGSGESGSGETDESETEETPAEVGYLEPGRRFRVLGTPGDFYRLNTAGFELDPEEEASLFVRRADAPSCESRGGVVADLFGAPEADSAESSSRVLGTMGSSAPASWDLELLVQNVRGLPGVTAGDRCTVHLERHVGRFPCRAVVSCGSRILYGARATFGFFQCVYGEGSPSVRGEDPRTSAASDDPSLVLDTDAQILRLDDDARGRFGEFHLEARIQSPQAAASPPPAPVP